MITLPLDQSFQPPALPNVVVGSYPDRVLLSVWCYIADRTNETTATSSTTDGHRIQVTFFAARPPALFHLCIYCPDGASFAIEPRVVASHGNLILLSAGNIPSSTSDLFGQDTSYDFFVYSADATTGVAPSLDLLPTPRHPIGRANVGLISGSGGSGYVVATLSPHPRRKRYILSVHHEKTGHWSRKIVSRKVLPTVESPAGGGAEMRVKVELVPLESTMVITLQGSNNIAWVDLRGTLLLCDVLDKDPVAYHIPLPEPLSDSNKAQLESVGDPRFFRDAIGRANSVRFVEMDYRYGACFTPDGWRAVTYSWGLGSKKWCVDSVVDFEDVLENSGGGLFSVLRPDSSKVVESKNIAPLCVPTLCDRDGILYLMSKPYRRCHEGSVAVVDTSKKTLESVLPMSDQRVIGYSLTYVHSTFSKFFNDVC
ncbi:hypothetical protein HU200_015135 [Digitaria exilis]|uniref:DUF1618 domain-containing protein n=1 Tax=Digitaria exilis TaxID=1010633 RepID=A0A835FAN7_9POAL|nr:hypothetical protein HU200_015135 [Digitaria exilis]